MCKRILEMIGAAALCLALLLPAVPAYAADTPEPKTVTYKEAVKMALKDLSGVLAMDDNMKPLKEQVADLQFQLDLVKEKFDGYGMKAPSAALAPLKGAINQINRQINLMRLNQDMIKLSTEMSLRNTLVNIHNNEMDIEMLTQSVALNEQNLERVKLRHGLGMASDNDLRSAEQTLTQSKTNLETLKLTLESEKQALNRILQVPLTQEVTVEYDRAVGGLPEDLSAYIKNKSGNQPNIKQLQITSDIKKADLDDNTDPTKQLTLQVEYDKSVRERDDAKIAMEAAIRANYNNLDQMMKREEYLTVDLEKAQANYRTAQANLDAGRITQYDVDNAALAVVNAEIAIEKNKNSLWTLHFAFANPFMLAN